MSTPFILTFRKCENTPELAVPKGYALDAIASWLSVVGTEECPIAMELLTFELVAENAPMKTFL
jgi:hypothetical protein